MVLVVKNLPANARDAGSIPGSGRSPAGGNGNPLQYSCWEIRRIEEPRGWQATVYVVPRSWTQQKQLSMHAQVFNSQATVISSASEQDTIDLGNQFQKK